MNLKVKGDLLTDWICRSTAQTYQWMGMPEIWYTDLKAGLKCGNARNAAGAVYSLIKRSQPIVITQHVGE